MPNELERLLDLACIEPGYAPEFYRCLLTSEVYALVPTVGHGMGEGKLRFVMWRGADGIDVIPYFASREALRRALKPGWEAVTFTGRALLKITHGATVVLNPNEAATSRLTPAEVTLLLDTGAVSSLERATQHGGFMCSLEVRQRHLLQRSSRCPFSFRDIGACEERTWQFTFHRKSQKRVAI